MSVARRVRTGSRYSNFAGAVTIAVARRDQKRYKRFCFDILGQCILAETFRPECR